MEELQKRSTLAKILSFTNVLGLAVIIALALVIKILLGQKVNVQKENKDLLAQLKKQTIELNDVAAVKGDLETKLTDLQANQGCEPYIVKLDKANKALAKAKNENYKILRTFQNQSSQLRHLSESNKILQGLISQDNTFDVN